MMISCRKCIEGFYPGDPRIRSGRYNMCSCDYYEKPDYFRELEQASTHESAFSGVDKENQARKVATTGY